MIKNQSQCPYCSASVVAYDWDADKIIFNPDLDKPEPCEHLAYAGVYCLTDGQFFSHRHTIWRHPAADASLDESDSKSLNDYLRHIGDGLANPDAPHEFADAEHTHQHKGGTDSITFFGIYSSDPAHFLRVCLDTMRERWRK